MEVDLSENAEAIVLVEKTGDCEATSVHFDDDRLWQVGLLVHWCFSKRLLQFPKSEHWPSGPCSVACRMLQQVGDWCCYCCIFADESLVDDYKT